jgi:hypothetical protein
MGDHVPWNNWCEFAFTHQVTLIGWPRLVMSPGPGFDKKKSITTDGWRNLVARIPAIWRNNPYRDEGMPELDIIVWPESMSNIYWCSYVVS